MTIEFIPADCFSIQDLADLYNRTRVDYLIPMPMNADRLAEYIRDFDISLHHSRVARDSDGQVLGLGMIGLRQGTAWITRLGVLPSSRRIGTGSAIVDNMLEAAEGLYQKGILLEVIKENTPAYQLFKQKDFHETGEYVVMRRAPRAATYPLLQGHTRWLERSDALRLLQTYPKHLTWVNDLPSMQNASSLQGIQIELPDGSHGWLLFRYHKFTLSHLVLHTLAGNPAVVGQQLLLHMHAHHPRQDAFAENIHVDDPHLDAYALVGYFENFHRIEMFKAGPDTPQI